MKHTKIIIAALLALTLTACSDTNTAEVSNLPDITESSTALTEDTTTAEETTSTTTTAEITTVSETETETETEEVSETVPTAVTEIDDNGIMTLKASADTKYYECGFTDENIVTDPEKFEDKTLLENVRKFFEKSEIYKEIHEGMDKEAEDMGFIQNGMYKFECVLKYAVTSDFNSDGQKESAFLFGFKHNCDDDFTTRDHMTNCLVFADSNGNISLSDEEFSYSSELIELKYNGFSHLVVNGGHNNFSLKASFYSVNDNGFKFEASDTNIKDYSDSISDGFLLKMLPQQAFYWHFICWNDDIKGYVTIDEVRLEQAEADKIIEQLPYNSNIDDLEMPVEEIKAGVSVIGNKYYSLYSLEDAEKPVYYNEFKECYERVPYSDFYLSTYAYNNGTYTKFDNVIGIRSEIDMVYLKDFDIDTAVGNIIPIE